MTVTLSDNAISKIRQLVGEKPDAGLRVKVVGGGCSGLQYRMEIDSAKERDKIFERDGARLIVDKKSFLYLNGSELDYAEELMSSGFRLVNQRRLYSNVACRARRKLGSPAAGDHGEDLYVIIVRILRDRTSRRQPPVWRTRSR